MTFVGSSPIASIVKDQCNKLHKRCTALGGAKNHLIALADCNVDETARDVVVSSAGCAGQRCMAASVLLLCDKGNELLNSILKIAKNIQAGTGPGQLGPVIDAASYNKIINYINDSEKGGAEILLDGRKWGTQMNSSGGHWVGPTVMLHHSKDDAAMKEEIFGPVLSIYRVENWAEAIEIENSNPFGNAACVYTTNGAYADWFVQRFRASMLGINVGIPVPREPFSFGGEL